MTRRVVSIIGRRPGRTTGPEESDVVRSPQPFEASFLRGTPHNPFASGPQAEEFEHFARLRALRSVNGAGSRAGAFAHRLDRYSIRSRISLGVIVFARSSG